MKHPAAPPAVRMNPISCIGSCLPMFLVAVFFDIVGLVVLFVGIFRDLRQDGRFYGDFLIYSGSIIIFASLAFWLMWYLGNVRVEEYDELRKRSSIVELARKLSEKLSQRMKGEERAKCVEDEEDWSQGGQGGPPRKSGRVTWGKSTAYYNEGYDSSMDPPDPKEHDLGSSDPGASDPGSSDPGASDPGSSDPGSSDPDPGKNLDSVDVENCAAVL